MEIVKTKRSRRDEVDLEDLGFGEVFSDHMFSMEYRDGTWTSPKVMPFGPIELLPSTCSLHYGQMVFEGLKAFYSKAGAINLFRPQKYHERQNKSCQKLCIPEMGFDLFINGIRELLILDKEWVPKKRGYSLYIRPFIFATDSFLGVKVSETYRFMIITSPVGAYYKEGINPVRLITPGEHIRAAKGGLGAAKTPANYAATLLPAEEAKEKGFTQVLWLDGVERRSSMTGISRNWKARAGPRRSRASRARAAARQPPALAPPTPMRAGSTWNVPAWASSHFRAA